MKFGMDIDHKHTYIFYRNSFWYVKNCKHDDGAKFWGYIWQVYIEENLQ